jgi:hypothetical protein
MYYDDYYTFYAKITQLMDVSEDTDKEKLDDWEIWVSLNLPSKRYYRLFLRECNGWDTKLPNASIPFHS